MDMTNKLENMDLDREEIRRRRVFRVFALLSYFLAFFYIKRICLEAGWFQNWMNAMFVFVILFICFVEAFCHFTGLTYHKLKEDGCSVWEPVVYFLCLILQGIAVLLYGIHDDWTGWQFLMLHFTAIYYVLARTGSLASGKSGILFLIDCLQGFITIPWSNIGIRLVSIFKRASSSAESDEDDCDEYEYDEAKEVAKEQLMKKVATILVTLVLALGICGYALMELTFASHAFYEFTYRIQVAIEDFFETGIFDWIYENDEYILLSIPVGAWLFGLIAGGIKKNRGHLTLKKFEDATISLHLLPDYSAYIIIGSVCALYAFFFATELIFMGAFGLYATQAHEASVRAVDSFWALIRIVLLNFAVVGGSCIVSRKALWENRKTRIFATVLFGFATAFALLATWNLCGVYIAKFGLTPRRILSSWVVGNVLLWCILMLIRLYKRIPAARIGIITAAISYSIVVLGDF
ncbi:MAG: DUF4173 domain-containing protein [Lachnospiraceae bacterium]|nr:DUF4173 domain-containing protein [Lachnospiraceae bacterium]